MLVLTSKIEGLIDCWEAATDYMKFTDVSIGALEKIKEREAMAKELRSILDQYGYD